MWEVEWNTKQPHTRLRVQATLGLPQQGSGGADSTNQLRYTIELTSSTRKQHKQLHEVISLMNVLMLEPRIASDAGVACVCERTGKYKLTYKHIYRNTHHQWCTWVRPLGRLGPLGPSVGSVGSVGSVRWVRWVRPLGLLGEARIRTDPGA